jgi:hypothetical protein
VTTREDLGSAGWFKTDAVDQLVGQRCAECGTYVFPPTATFCRNPACNSDDLRETSLSTRGTLWSYTVNHYAPPPPAVTTDPFEPYGVAAVELAAEKMIVLGQISGSTDGLQIGDAMELVVEPLAGTDDRVWKWRKA